MIFLLLELDVFFPAEESLKYRFSQFRDILRVRFLFP